MLQVQIGAQVDEAVSGITLVKNVLADLAQKGGVSIAALEFALKDFQVRLKAATDPKDIARLNSAITALGQKIKELKGLGAGSFDGLARSSNSANLALINTGRVIQDLPFGFLGIANNLNPLLESFQRLKAESGSTATALSTMVKSLGGAQGLGIALSIVSSLLLVFRDSLFGTKKAAEDNAIALGLFNNKVKEIEDSVGDLSKQLQFLNQLGDIRIDIVFGKGLAADIIKQNAAIVSGQFQMVELNKKLADATKLSNEAQTKFTKALSGSQIIALDAFSKLSDVPDDVAEKFSKADKKLFESAKNAAEGVKKVQEEILKVGQSQAIGANTIDLLKIEKLKEDSDKAQKEFDKFKAANERFVNETIAEGKKLADFFEGRRVVPVFSVLDTAKQQFDKAVSEIKDFKTGDLKIILKVPIEPEPEFAFQSGFLEKQLQQAKDKTLLPRFRSFLDEFKSDIDKLKLDVKPTIQLSPKLEQARVDANILKDLTDELLKLGGTVPPINLNVPIKINTDLINLAIAKQKITNDLNKAINEALAGITTEGFTALGESIGAALSGGDLSSVFQKFASSLGSAVEALGKQMILFGVKALLLKQAIKVAFSNPALLVAAGIALVAIGSAIKNAVGQGLQGFAKGGRPPVGQDILVGEKGPEIVRLDRPGTVFTAHETKRIMSDAANPVRLSSSHVKELTSEVSKVISSQIERFTTVFNNVISTATNKIDTFRLTTVKEKESKETIRLLDHLVNKETKVIFQTPNNNLTNSITKLFHDNKVATNSKEFKDNNITTNNASFTNEIKESFTKLFQENKTVTNNESITKLFKDSNATVNNLINKASTVISNIGDTIKNIHVINFGDHLSRITNNLKQTFINTFTTLIPARAQGGPVQAGKMHLVGEKGPELFSPKVPGFIVPHHKLKEVYKYVTNNTRELFRSVSNIQTRQFGGTVYPGQQYLTGEIGAEGFVSSSRRLTPTINTQGIQGNNINIGGEFRLAGTDLVLVLQRELGKQGRLV